MNRTLCATLEDMRTCVKHLNFSLLPSLIEEVQLLGNRMEAGLWDQKDVIRLREEVKELKAKRNKLRKKIEKLEKKEGGEA